MTLVEEVVGDSEDVIYHAVFLNGLPGQTPTADVVVQHAAHLAQLDREGKLALAGPFLGRFAGLLILRTVSVAEATRIADEDPMIRGGFQSYEVVRWAQAWGRNHYQPNLNPRASR
jgi:uncharacterized protein YciI